MECISKYQAYSALRSEAAEHEFPASKEAFERAARIIDQIPAADVRLVRRGKWVDKKTAIFTSMCSICSLSISENDSRFYKYCPNCGAEMYGGVNNEKTDV